jgi:hypothetical protein
LRNTFLRNFVQAQLIRLPFKLYSLLSYFNIFVFLANKSSFKIVYWIKAAKISNKHNQDGNYRCEDGNWDIDFENRAIIYITTAEAHPPDIELVPILLSFVLEFVEHGGNVVMAVVAALLFWYQHRSWG